MIYYRSFVSKNILGHLSKTPLKKFPLLSYWMNVIFKLETNIVLETVAFLK